MLEAARIERAGMIWGRRDGRGFGHCHGCGRLTGTGQARPREWGTCSHPTRSLPLTPCSCLAVRRCRFDAERDTETGFTLFSPVATSAAPAVADAALLRLAPDEDLPLSLSGAVAELGWPRARVQGIGSINEVRFRDGGVLASYATEFLVTDAQATAQGAGIGLSVVGLGGEMAAGILESGDNPVLMTAELILLRT